MFDLFWFWIAIVIVVLVFVILGSFVLISNVEDAYGKELPGWVFTAFLLLSLAVPVVGQLIIFFAGFFPAKTAQLIKAIENKEEDE